MASLYDMGALPGRGLLAVDGLLDTEYWPEPRGEQ